MVNPRGPLVTNSTEGGIDARRIQREARRYEALISAEGSIVWVLDPELRPTGRNQAWELYTGQSADEYAQLGWLSAIHPEDREHIRASAQLAAANGSPMALEFRVRRADGEYRRTAVRAIPIHEDGRVIRPAHASL